MVKPFKICGHLSIVTLSLNSKLHQKKLIVKVGMISQEFKADFLSSQKPLAAT